MKAAFRSGIILLATLTSGMVHAQTSADPTFNGLANTIRCSVAAISVCPADNFCLSQVGGGRDIWISLKDKKISATSTFNGPEERPIKIMEISPAAINANLHVKFSFQESYEKGPTNFIIYFVPNSGQYKILFGQTSFPPPKNDTPAQTKMLIQGGACTVQQ